jgi:hypothetical protein
MKDLPNFIPQPLLDVEMEAEVGCDQIAIQGFEARAHLL